MPTYQYVCLQCKTSMDITKSIHAYDDEEKCEKCASILTHYISPINIATSNCQFKSHFNHAFGKVIHSKNQIHNEIRRINGESGKDIVEVGNDNLQSVKKRYKKYDDSISLGDFS